MNFNEYQNETEKTAKYPDFTIIQRYLEEPSSPIYSFLYPALGLSGETGEVLEVIKKIVRDRRSVTEEDKKKIEGELGDVLWYLAQLAARFNLSLDDIAKNNLKKLEERYAE